MNTIEGNILNANANVIIHQVNCQGVMGGGLARQIKERFPSVYAAYKTWCDKESPLLGKVQVVYPDEKSTFAVANLFAQDLCGFGDCYTDYDALRKCLYTVNKLFTGQVVAVPYKMSCGLAGGDWNIVSKMLEDLLKDCTVCIYRLNNY